MRVLPAFVILIVASACACAPGVEELESAEDKPLSDSASLGIPDDASTVASRLVSCTHFAGEFNGDQSERDKEVAVVMAELRCDTIESEAAAIRRKYSGNTAVMEALDSANEL